MDISAEKLTIIQRICEIRDTDLLDLIRNIIDVPKISGRDWWNEIPDEEKASIERGVSDLKKGDLHSHDQIRMKYERFFKDQVD